MTSITSMYPVIEQRPFDPTPSDLRLGSETNRILGHFKTKWGGQQLGRLDHVELRAGGHLGSRDGYASLKDAVSALAYLTKDNKNSAAVIQEKGRFYGYQLRERDLTQGLFSPFAAPSFEPNQGSVVDFRTVSRDENLAAIVDGDYAHTFLR